MNHKPTILLLFVFLVSLVATLPAEAATLSLFPGAGSYSIGESFTSYVVLDSPTQAANAISGVVNFPADKLQVVSLTKGATIDFWVEQPTFSNSQGTVRFEGVTFNPGFSGYGGRVLTVTFRGRVTGEAVLDFQSASILANDGEGTNITDGDRGATITLLAARPAPPPQSEGVVVITSKTHPDSTKWYSSRAPEILMSFPTGTLAISALVDENATATPPTTAREVVTSYTSSELNDGIWYFHARARQPSGWSRPSHFSIQIDSQPPQPFVIKLVNGLDIMNTTPEIVFGTKDDLSGVVQYEVFVNSEKITTVSASSSELYHLVRLPYEPWGTRKIRVIATDQAGNTTESTAEFVVQSSVWLFVILAIALLFILLLIWFLVFGWRTRKKLGENIQIKIQDLLPEKADLELFKQSEMVNKDLEGLYIDLRNLLALKSQHKSFLYLRQARAKKMTTEDISRELRSAGWSDEEILSLMWEERAVEAISEKIEKNLEELKR